MDREISKEIRQKEQRKRWLKWGGGVVVAALVVSGIFKFMQSAVRADELTFSTVDTGTIDVSVSASGKVVPAFEEIVNSPIDSKILEVYKKGGDSVSLGTPILRLDLQTAETDYQKQLDEEKMKELQLEQLRIQNRSKLCHEYSLIRLVAGKLAELVLKEL